MPSVKFNFVYCVFRLFLEKLITRKMKGGGERICNLTQKSNYT